MVDSRAIETTEKPTGPPAKIQEISKPDQMGLYSSSATPEEEKGTFNRSEYYDVINTINSFRELSTNEQNRTEQLNSIILGADILKQALQTDEFSYEVLFKVNQLARFSDSAEAAKFARSFIEENIGTIESFISKEDLEGSERPLEVIANLLDPEGTETQKKLGHAVFGRQIGVIEAGLLDERWRNYVPYVAPLVTDDNPQVADSAKDVIINIFKQADKIAGPTILSSLLSSSATREKGKYIIGGILQSYGLDSEDIVEAWEASGYSSDYREEPHHRFTPVDPIEVNLDALRRLEVQRPGITSFLNKEFGIRDFARYPEELLIAQYDQFENLDLPYGVVLYPRGDHNGAFYQNKEVLGQLFQQLDSRYAIRVVEAEGKYDIARQLIKLKQRYGSRHKISFAMIGGHGEKYSIEFGDFSHGDILSISDLKGKGVQRTPEFFEPEPTIILASCSTGEEGGIAQQLSGMLGAKVIAPKLPTTMDRIETKIEDGKIDFNVIYSKDNPVNVFARGKLDG